MADDSQVQISFGADTGELNNGVDQVKSKVKELGDSAPDAADKFAELGKQLLEIFAIDKLVEFTDKINEMGEQIERTVAMTSMTGEQVQTLGFALDMTGGDASSLGSIMSRLERNILAASTGSGAAYDAFTRMGVSLDEIRTKSPYELVQLLADKFNELGPSIQRTADMSIIGGRGFIQMASAFSEGKEGLEAFHTQLEATGVLLSSEQTDAFAKSAEASKLLGKAYEGLGISIYTYFKPALDDAKQSIIDMTEEETNSARTGGSDFQKFLEGAAATLEFFITGLKELKVEYLTLSKEIGAIAATMASDTAHLFQPGVIKENYAILQQQLTDYQTDADKAFKHIEESGANAIKGIIEAQKGLQSEPAVNALDNALSSGGGAAGAPKATADTSIESEDISSDEAVAKARLATQIAILQQEQAYHAITKQQEIEQEKQAADAEYAIELDALQQNLELYKKGGAEYDATLNKMDVLYAQHVEKIAQLDVKIAQANAQTANKMSQEFQQVFNTIDSDFNKMLTSVLAGQSTWEAAFTKMFDSMATSAVEAMLKIIAEWLVFEALTEGQGTWSSFVALEGSGKAGVGSQLIKSFDVGSWNIPNDQIAQIHAGEMIIPAQQAGEIRSGAASIGGSSSASGGSSGQPINVNFNISAIDTQNASQFIQNNMRTITQGISTSLRNNSSILQGYKAS